MLQVSILGCGWLGFPLAETFIAENVLVKGSTTSVEKLSKLSDHKIIPFQIEVYEEGIKGDMQSFLKDSEILIINIPPKLRSQAESYVVKMQRISTFIGKSSVKKVLLVSSTSVYKETPEFPIYNEADLPNAEGFAAKQLIEVENLFFENQKFEISIVRFGGLIGKDRHPVKYLAGKELRNPKAPVNLIQQQDCVHILKAIVLQNCWGKIFNAVYPHHPSRIVYYSQKSRQQGLPEPKNSSNDANEGKVIKSKNIREDLKYHFQYPI